MRRLLAFVAVLTSGLVSVLASLPPALAQSDTLQIVRSGVAIVQTPTGYGSAWVILGQGLVITAAHVVGDLSSVTVTIPGFRSTAGRVLTRSQQDDVAVVEVPGLAREQVGLRLYEGRVFEGDEVYAFGFIRDAANFHLTMTRGIVGKVFSNAYQIDASLRPGFSGGPITNRGGRVIGMASFSLSGPGNFNFIVPLQRIMQHAAVHMTQAIVQPPVPRPQQSPPAAGADLGFFYSVGDYRAQSYDFRSWYVAGAVDYYTYQAVAQPSVRLSVGVARCTQALGRASLADYLRIVDDYAARTDDGFQAAGTVGAAFLGDCAQSGLLVRAQYFVLRSDYRIRMDRSAQVAYLAGVHDAMSFQASFEPSAQLAIQAARCISSVDRLGDLHAIVDRYLPIGDGGLNVEMPALIVRAFIAACR